YAAAFASADPRRLRCAMIAPLNHPVQAAAEIAFAHDQLGMTVLLASFTAPGARSLSSPDLDVVWAAAHERAITVTFQDSSLSAVPTTSGIARAKTWRMLYLATHIVEAQLGLADLILGGVPDRFPALRFGMQETHLTWLPSWLQLLDERFGHRRQPSVRPSDAFRRQFFASGFPDEPGVRRFIDEVGGRNLVFASDWPHRELMPGTDPNWTAEVLRRNDLSAAEAVAALETNPNHWFSN
ncbi:MAG TPA: amidohydrolase family protein, partial [Ilumatobacteraceae bacterium]|nr:amidohydrolase family protein [Ilumatobacteraceae bacterium]